jgi:hypothetical protein
MEERRGGHKEEGRGGRERDLEANVFVETEDITIQEIIPNHLAFAKNCAAYPHNKELEQRGTAKKKRKRDRVPRI